MASVAMRAAKQLISHPVESFFPTPELRTSGGLVDQAAQKIFLANYHSRATKAVTFMCAAICLLTVSSVAGAVGLVTFSKAYAYVAVATCVAGYASLSLSSKFSPHAISRQVTGALKKGNVEMAIHLLSQGGYSAYQCLVHGEKDKEAKFLRSVLSLGLGLDLGWWSACSVAQLMTLQEAGQVNTKGTDYPKQLFGKLRDAALLHEWSQKPMVSLVDQLEVFDLMYRKRGEIELKEFIQDHISTVRTFIGRVIDEQERHGTRWTEICETLRAIQQQLSADAPATS